MVKWLIELTIACEADSYKVLIYNDSVTKFLGYSASKNKS